MRRDLVRAHRVGALLAAPGDTDLSLLAAQLYDEGHLELTAAVMSFQAKRRAMADRSDPQWKEKAAKRIADDLEALYGEGT